MEKLDKPQSKEYGPLELWANDLAEILAILKECTKVTFVSDDIKYDTIEEFINENRGRNVTEVKISTYEPYITVELHQKWARIYVSSSSSLASGLFHKIDLILCKCERKPRFLYQYWWVWGCSVVITNIFLLPPMKPYSDLSVWAYALVSSWIIYAVFINLWRFSLIHSIYHEDSPSFIRRNIDAIVISVVSALIGAVVGVVVTKIIDRVLPNSPTSSTASQQPSNQPNKFKD